MIDVITTALLFVGAALMFLAAVGILRMPDLFTRMQAASKAGMLGAACMLLAVAVFFGELGVIIRAMAAIAFFALTVPVSAHMIGRAAYFVGIPMWKGTIVDELQGLYDPQTHELDSGPRAAARQDARERRIPASNPETKGRPG